MTEGSARRARPRRRVETKSWDPFRAPKNGGYSALPSTSKEKLVPGRFPSLKGRRRGLAGA